MQGAHFKAIDKNRQPGWISLKALYTTQDHGCHAGKTFIKKRGHAMTKEPQHTERVTPKDVLSFYK